MSGEISPKEKKALKEQLYHGDKSRYCHYCGISEKDFKLVWDRPFYGVGTRGRSPEIDRINPDLPYTLENCVLACAICNMAKSDQFKHDEFMRVGAVIKEIWQARKGSTRLLAIKPLEFGFGKSYYHS